MVGNIKNRLHKVYKGFVPLRWRTHVRWVWGIALICAILWSQFLNAPENLRVYFYDVGQGDAIHVRTPEGFDVLIDGGPTSRILEKLGGTMPFWDKDIELMILTHPHADHVTGLIEVLRRFKVHKVIATGVLHTTDEYLAFLKEVKEQEIPMDLAVAPQEIQIYKTQNTNNPQVQSPKLEIIYPVEDHSGKRVTGEKIGEGGGLNDTSIVARLTYGSTSFLFTGDATSAVEEQLLSSQSSVLSSQCEDNTENCSLRTDKLRLRADVLKVGHHGSKYSTTREFLNAVKPTYAVIQVGKNNYGHPTYSTLYRLKQAGVEVFRNDQDGDVVFESDGLDIKKMP